MSPCSKAADGTFLRVAIDGAMNLEVRDSIFSL
jgi:hypothetical protein